MSEIIFILGKSGAGKSTSITKDSYLKIQGLDPKNTALINVDNKRLSGENGHEWSKENKNIIVTRKPEVVKSSLLTLSKSERFKNIVIDDFQYIFADQLIHGLNERVGLQLYTEIVYQFTTILDICKQLRDDQLVFITSHLEEYETDFGSPKLRMKTIGNSINKNITPEGKSSIVLYAEGKKKDDKIVKYFRTQGDGMSDTCKSPSRMFANEDGSPKMEIPNDLNYVENQVRKFWKL